MFDSHIHIDSKTIAIKPFMSKLAEAGVDSAILLSLPPDNFFTAKEKFTSEARLENLMAWCRADGLFPFFWVDLLSDDAEKQVARALECGVYGFKVICDHFFASDKKAMKVFHLIAEAGKPILFHSGILWDGKVSAKYNRPMEFECLLAVPKLRFALAHASWPWCDELVALYGKFLNAYSLNPDISVEMFIDMTPGTPVIYREEVLRKIFTVGYDVEHNILFGSDSTTENFNTKWTSDWQRRDAQILDKLGLSQAQMNCYFSGNAKRFLGLENSRVEKVLPQQGQ